MHAVEVEGRMSKILMTIYISRREENKNKKLPVHWLICAEETGGVFLSTP
jgi:hypothetical protein